MHRACEGPHVRALCFFALILLTGLDGSAIWVEATQVQVIRIRSAECGPGAGSVVRIGQTTLCVKENADEIREKIREAQ
jgi:uncharacterized protein YlzI (FlbEa/FlbD family)